MFDDWIAQQCAPITGSVEENYPHPVEGKALQDYLAGSISADQGARAIMSLIEHEEDLENCSIDRIWGLLGDGMKKLGPLARTKIVLLIKAIASLPSQLDDTGPETRHYNVAPWEGATSFGDSWYEDERYDQGWRGHLKQADQAAKDAKALQYRTCAQIDVEILQHVEGVIGLDWGLVCICDALESSSNAYPEIELPAVYEWISGVGEKVEAAVKNRYKIWKWLGDRSLWHGGDVLDEHRWAFWLQRLKLFEQSSELSSETQGLALRTRQIMESWNV